MNTTRWDFTKDNNNPPWAMDVRHIRMVTECLIGFQTKRAVEIGCLNGRSSVAFVEAVEQGSWLKWVGFCDTKPTDGIRRVAGELANKGIAVETLWNDSKLIPWVADTWLIDGDHAPEAVWADFHKALKGSAKVLIIHDTYHHLFPGPGEVAKLLRNDAGFTVWEDFKKREGEETDRGLTIAAMNFPHQLMNRLNDLAK